MANPEYQEGQKESQGSWAEQGEIDPQRLREALNQFTEAVRRDRVPPHLRPPFLLRPEDRDRRIS